MRLSNITMAGIILLMLAFVISPVNAGADNATTDTSASDAVSAAGDEENLVDDIQPDEGIIGPDNVLYKLKIAFEDLDVAFTFNESEKVGKQVSQARHRLAEIKSALKKNNIQAAETAIDQYDEETENAEESISRFARNDTGLIRAQAMIAKHGYVLEGLIESHPNNTGLLRAYNNSERLLSKFALKTSIKLERMTDKMGRKVLKHVRVDEDESGEYEKTSIKASVEDSKTHVKVELRFVTNSTEPADIAGDIAGRIDAIETNVSDIIKIERDDAEDDDEAEPNVTATGAPTTTLTAPHIRDETPSGEKMKAEAEVRGNITRVRFEYSFFLNATEDSAIVSGVEEKLSSLTEDKILSSLDVNVKERRVEIEEKERDDRNKMEINEKKKEDRPQGEDKEGQGKEGNKD